MSGVSTTIPLSHPILNHSYSSIHPNCISSPLFYGANGGRYIRIVLQQFLSYLEPNLLTCSIESSRRESNVFLKCTNVLKRGGGGIHKVVALPLLCPDNKCTLVLT